MGESKMVRMLRIEELEERIAPTVVAVGGSAEFTDGDGDTIRVSYLSGPAGSETNVTDAGGGDMGAGDSIGWISLADSDYTSILVVENLGGGDGRTDILYGVQTSTNFSEVGVISLGVSADGSDAGPVDLASGAQVAVSGELGMLLLNGDIDFDAAGHMVITEGDVGLVEVRGDMALDPVNGARIFADTGVGDISFIRVTGSITEGTGGGDLATIPVGTGWTFADDANDGGDGWLTVKVTGAGATGTLTLIPVAGGGEVLSRLELSAGAGAAISAIGGGGDVTDITGLGAVGTVLVSGVADVDLYSVSGAGITSVINRTIGGDIISVTSSAGIGLIQTQRLGNVGAAFTGAGNSVPLVVLADLSEMSGVEAAGAITSIIAGGVVNTGIDATALGTLRAYPGGISGVDVDISGGIGTIVATDIESSTIYAETGIASLRVGTAGIIQSDISSRGNIGLVQTRGSITGSTISTKFEDGGGNVSGASIVNVQAGSVFGSTLEAFGGFGSVRVKGAFVNSSVDSRFEDTFLGHDVGGAVGAFSAGGMYLNARVEAFGNISSVAVGSGGIVQGSVVDTGANLLRLNVRGDVSDDTIINATAGITTAFIAGDLAFNARVGTAGNIGSLSIGGEIMGGDVIVGGNLTRLSVRGGINGIGVTLAVGGDVGTFNVTRGVHGFSPGGEVSINVTGNLANFNVRGGMSLVNVFVGGNVTKMSAAAGGEVYDCSFDIDGTLGSARIRASEMTMAVAGNAGTIQILGDAANTGVQVGGSITTFSVAGALTRSTLDFNGDVSTLSVRGAVNNTSIDFGEDGLPVSVGKVTVGGGIGSCDINAWGNTGQVAVKGSIVSSGLTVRGNVDTVSVSRGIYGSYLHVQGDTDRFSVRNSVHDSQTLFDDGVADYAVKGSIYNANIGNYDVGSGNPLGAGGIGRLTAQDINGSRIAAFGGIGEVTARGTIYGAIIDAFGDAGAGASITKIAAKGLNSSSVSAYGSIGLIFLGDEGIDGGTTIEAVNGDLGSIVTRGLIFGDVTVGGDLTGQISSAGTDAVDLGTEVDLYFTDTNGNITGGTLDVAGAILGPVS